MTDDSPVSFCITPARPEAHLFVVVLTIRDPDPGGQALSLPAWIPGSYLIRDFARHVVQLRAENGAGPVAVSKSDKHTWRCAPCAGPLTVTYEVHAWELSVRAAYLDTGRGYFNGSSVFLCVRGCEHLAHDVEIRPPPGEAYADWRVATALPRHGAPDYGFGRYRAADYEELIDHPVEMGRFTVVSFEAGGRPHDMVITGRQRADTARLGRDLARLCARQIEFFGELPSFERYLFLVTAVDEGHGGLEHRASCSLLCSRDDLPQRNQAEMSDKYRGFLGLCSHEYFHLWHVKRIRPAAFIPYDLAAENYTRLLWAFEGITSYYQNLLLRRSGLISAGSYLELLAQTITRVWRGAGRLKQSLAESSFDAWIKLYKPDDNTPNAVVSYYTKGTLVALALDLTIRRDSAGASSLDDVMRALWERHGRTGVGVPEDDVERLAEEISSSDLKPFFQQVVHGTADPPLAELLPQFGVGLEWRPAASAADAGGRRTGQPPETLARRAVLGVRLAEQDGAARLACVFDGGAAQRAGLAAGDVIVAVDRLRADRTTLDGLLAAYEPGETVTVHAFRRDELRSFAVTLQAPPADTCALRLLDAVDETVRTRRAVWLDA
jgi:predicted metalloprotease with PDZ domain